MSSSCAVQMCFWLANRMMCTDRPGNILPLWRHGLRVRLSHRLGDGRCRVARGPPSVVHPHGLVAGAHHKLPRARAVAVDRVQLDGGAVLQGGAGAPCQRQGGRMQQHRKEDDRSCNSC